MLLLASGPRFAWAVRAWSLILVGFAAAWLPARFAPDLPVPVREGLLVPAAVGLALAVGLGAAALLSDLGRRGFGWRQISAVLATGALVVATVGVVIGVPLFVMAVNAGLAIAAALSLVPALALPVGGMAVARRQFAALRARGEVSLEQALDRLECGDGGRGRLTP